jgi:hypothetical protein
MAPSADIAIANPPSTIAPPIAITLPAAPEESVLAARRIDGRGAAAAGGETLARLFLVIQREKAPGPKSQSSLCSRY